MTMCLIYNQALITLITSDSQNIIEWMCSSIIYINLLGKTLLFETNVHCFTKEEFKIFAFSSKSVTNASLNSKGGITRTFLPLKKVFIID